MASLQDSEISRGLTETTDAQAQQQRLEQVAAYVLDRVRALGASAAEVGASVHQGLSVTVRMREVETVEFSRDRGVGITVYFGQRKGSASTADLQPESVDASIDTACAIARFTEADPAAGLADANRMATELPDLDLWHPWDLTADDAIELGREIEAAALDHHPLISNSEGATVDTAHAVSIYANSHGFVGRRLSTRHSLSCSVLAEDDSDKQRDYYYDTRRARQDLMPAAEIGAEAARRTVARHGAREMDTVQAPVIYVPEMARSLLGHFIGAISGGNLYRGSSFLIDAQGAQLFPKFVTIEERPFLPRGLRSAAFDNEGVATAERRIIDQGVLTGYVLGSYSARKLKLESTGNSGGVHNLTLRPGTQSFDDLVRSMGRGLIVTELMGQGVNTTTGDYSRGAAGFWVEDGEIVWPVEGVTVAGNLRDMYAAIAAVGNDIDSRSSILTPSILLERVTIAGS